MLQRLLKEQKESDTVIISGFGIKSVGGAVVYDILKGDRSDVSIVLMENAAIACVNELKKDFGNLSGKRIAVFCGKGNNGVALTLLF